jgi:tetratricopeptide (TPR) repeat protein
MQLGVLNSGIFLLGSVLAGGWYLQDGDPPKARTPLSHYAVDSANTKYEQANEMHEKAMLAAPDQRKEMLGDAVKLYGEAIEFIDASTDLWPTINKDLGVALNALADIATNDIDRKDYLRKAEKAYLAALKDLPESHDLGETLRHDLDGIRRELN